MRRVLGWFEQAGLKLGLLTRESSSRDKPELVRCLQPNQVNINRPSKPNAWWYHPPQSNGAKPLAVTAPSSSLTSTFTLSLSPSLSVYLVSDEFAWAMEKKSWRCILLNWKSARKLKEMGRKSELWSFSSDCGTHCIFYIRYIWLNPCNFFLFLSSFLRCRVLISLKFDYFFINFVWSLVGF